MYRINRTIRFALAVSALLATVFFAGSVQADTVGGPRAGDKVIAAHSTQVFHIAFNGEEPASAFADGDGDIDMFVYDADGDPVTSDTDYDFTPLCMWTPPYTQTYTIKVVNNENYVVHYHIETN